LARHFARSALGVRCVFASLSIKGVLPKNRRRTHAHSKSPASAGRNTKFSQGAKTTSTDQTERFPVRLCDLRGERGPSTLLTGPSFAPAFQGIELLAP